MKADVLITERPTTMRKDLEHRLQKGASLGFATNGFPIGICSLPFLMEAER